jgi:hypothetical protein
MNFIATAVKKIVVVVVRKLAQMMIVVVIKNVDFAPFAGMPN